MISGFFVCAAFLIRGISITSGEAILKAETSNSSKKSTAEGSKGEEKISKLIFFASSNNSACHSQGVYASEYKSCIYCPFHGPLVIKKSLLL